MSNYLSSAIVSAAQAIFGTKRLVSGYAGHAFDLRYGGDNATLTVDFLGDDTLNVASINAWVAARSGGPTSVFVTKWYDQSGLANHLVQATTGNQPCLEVNTSAFINSEWTMDGLPVVIFQDPVILSGIQAYLSCATGSFSGLNFSILAVQRFGDCAPTQQNSSPAGCPFQLGLSSNVVFNFNSFSSLNTVSPVQPKFVKSQMDIGGAFKNSGTVNTFSVPTNSMSVTALRSNASATKFQIGSWRTASAGVGTASTGLTGYSVGVSNGTAFPSSCVMSAAVITTALADADQSAGMVTLGAAFTANLAPTTLLATEGDSISAGYVSSTGLWIDRMYSWMRTLCQSLGVTVIGHNVAQSGGWLGNLNSPYGAMANQSAGTANVQQGPQAPDSLDPLIDKTVFTNHILIPFIGTNDLNLYYTFSGSQTGYGATLFATYKAYCQARQVAGWKVIICSIIPREGFVGHQVETERLAFNSAMAADHAWADGYVDLASLNWLPGGSWVTNYQQADGIGTRTHPNPAGQTMIAAAFVTPVKSLTQTSSGGTFVPLSNFGQLGVMTF